MNWKTIALAAAVTLFISGCNVDTAGPRPMTGAEGSKGATGEGYTGPKPSFGMGTQSGGGSTTGGGAGVKAPGK